MKIVFCKQCDTIGYFKNGYCSDECKKLDIKEEQEERKKKMKNHKRKFVW